MTEPKAHDPLNALTALQFLFVTGKGGVGKSTISGLLGVHAANQGRDALLVLPQTSHNTPSLFGRELSEEPQVIYQNHGGSLNQSGSLHTSGSLSVVVIDPDAAMREYCRQVLRSRALTDALFHPRVAGGFLSGIPGLGEWALLGKSWAWSRSGTFELPAHQRHYDLVIFDAPASGDGTKMLKVPQVIMDLSPGGRLRDDAQRCRDMLADKGRSAVVLVTLAEDLSITETKENLSFIETELGFPVGPLLINRLIPALISPPELGVVQDALRVLGSEPASHAELLRLLRAAVTYGTRQSGQATQLARVATWARPTIQVPEMMDDLENLTGSLGALTRLLSAVTRTAAG
jgi:anion-transporting  ArsA/GET3 family ATPase